MNKPQHYKGQLLPSLQCSLGIKEVHFLVKEVDQGLKTEYSCRDPELSVGRIYNSTITTFPLSLPLQCEVPVLNPGMTLHCKNTVVIYVVKESSVVL